MASNSKNSQEQPTTDPSSSSQLFPGFENIDDFLKVRIQCRKSPARLVVPKN